MENQTERLVQLIDERLIRLERDLTSIIGRLGNAADCGCLLDNGCCNDKGCCQDKGCCKQRDQFDPDWEELVSLSDRIDVPIADLIQRIQMLDPKLLGARR